jgi:DNA-binding MarR family transcriptional regulator
MEADDLETADRYITKIAREASKFTVRNMKAEGVGTGEFDFIHLVRHRPGITQAEVREELKIDKGAAARRAASLEAKGYLTRRDKPGDRRSRCLFATQKAEELRNSKAFYETAFYEWLFAGLTEQDAAEFRRILSALYERSKKESRAGFPDIQTERKTEE